jgi:hypothetical protein
MSLSRMPEDKNYHCDSDPKCASEVGTYRGYHSEPPQSQRGSLESECLNTARFVCTIKRDERQSQHAAMMASVELAITRETMLRSTSNCAPSAGRGFLNTEPPRASRITNSCLRREGLLPEIGRLQPLAWAEKSWRKAVAQGDPWSKVPRWN